MICVLLLNERLQHHPVCFPQIRVGALTCEVLELRSQLEDAASARERELHSLQETCTDLRSRADIALKEVDHPLQEAKCIISDTNILTYTWFPLTCRTRYDLMAHI